MRLKGAMAPRSSAITLRGGDGTVTVRGRANLGDKPNLALQFEAERFRALGRIDRQLTVSGTLGLDVAEIFKLDGKIRVDEGLFDLSRSDAPTLDSDVSVRQAQPAAAEAPVVATGITPAPQPAGGRGDRPGRQAARARPRAGHHAGRQPQAGQREQPGSRSTASSARPAAPMPPTARSWRSTVACWSSAATSRTRPGRAGAAAQPGHAGGRGHHRPAAGARACGCTPAPT